MLIYPLAFIVTLGVLVTFHEFGHYIVARWSGVRILKFSVGFGRALWSRTNRHGTEFAIGALPLGGYVRMLDERDPQQTEPIDAEEVSFNRLSVWWRLAIAVAGPFANFLLAILIYGLLALAGTASLLPMVGQVDERSPAAAAGLPDYQQIVAIDGQAVNSWQEVVMALAERIGETGDIGIVTRTPGASSEQQVDVPVTDWLHDEADPNLLDALGLTPSRLAVVGDVQAGDAADRAGLEPWDRVLSIDGEAIDTWAEMVEAVQAAPDTPMRWTFLRDGAERQAIVTPDPRPGADGEAFGFVGIRAPLATVRYGPVDALWRGVEETGAMSALMLDHLGKLLFGQMSARNLGGPITIAKVAGDSATAGWQVYVGMLALLSVSLGILNLLPIPLLDGGHVVYCLAEIVSRRPVSVRVQALGGQLGVVLIGGLMVLVFVNDFLRFF